MEKREYAVELKHGGHNCCQAVIAAYADKLELPVELLDRMAATFGGGMATMAGSCGALCGAQMVLGLMRFEGRPLRRQARALTEAFESKAGAIRCRDLKGIDTGTVLTGCDDCVRYAVDALEAALEAEG